MVKTRNTRARSHTLAEVVAWTGSPQSFTDVSGSGPYHRDSAEVTSEGSDPRRDGTEWIDEWLVTLNGIDT